MFPNRFFPNRMFTKRFWPDRGFGQIITIPVAVCLFVKDYVVRTFKRGVTQTEFERPER